MRLLPSPDPKEIAEIRRRHRVRGRSASESDAGSIDNTERLSQYSSVAAATFPSTIYEGQVGRNVEQVRRQARTEGRRASTNQEAAELEDVFLERGACASPSCSQHAKDIQYLLKKETESTARQATDAKEIKVLKKQLKDFNSRLCGIENENRKLKEELKELKEKGKDTAFPEASCSSVPDTRPVGEELVSSSSDEAEAEEADDLME